jgi:outer membrane receptor protein involved in Fe transport
LPEAIQGGEEIVVVGSAPTVDVGSTATGANITSDFTSRVPVARPTGKGGSVRSFESVAETVPGAKADQYGVSISGTTSPENQYMLDGLSVNNTAFGVIGTPLSIEFIKEVNVISGGYMPEYGRATGGILDVVTKSGSNEFHGSVFGTITPGIFEGAREAVVRQGQTINTSAELRSIRDFGFDIGGPLVKDKLWFYGGMQVGVTTYRADRWLSRIVLGGDDQPVTDERGFQQTEEIEGTRRSFDVEQRTFQYIGKLTWAVNQDNQLSVAVYGAPTISGGRGNFGIVPSSGALEANELNNIRGTYGALAHEYVSSSNDVLLKYSTAFQNKKILVDAVLGWHHENSGGQFGRPADGSEVGSNEGLAGLAQVSWNRAVDASGNPAPHSITEFETVPGGQCNLTPEQAAASGLNTLCPVFEYFSGGSGAIQEASINRYQGKVMLTNLFEAAGHHVAKLGLDVELMGYEIKKAYTGGKIYSEEVDYSGPIAGEPAWTEIRQLGFLRGPDDPVVQSSVTTDNSSVTVGGFLQNSWSILDKVTLNLGVRYDTQLLYNTDGNLGMVVPNQVSPRAGVIYDFTQKGKSKIYASFARYHESVPLDIADRALSGDRQIRSYRRAEFEGRDPATGVACDPRTNENQEDTGTCLNPGSALDLGSSINANRAWRNTGAGKTPIDPDLSPQAADEFVVGAEYEIIPDGRLGVYYTKRYMVNVIEDMSVDEAETYFIGNPGSGIAADFPEAERDYDAVTFHFTKAFKNLWLAQASYTVSYLRGNYAGLFRPETTQLDPNINADFDLVVLTQNRTGPLPGDRTHSFKLYGAKDFVLPRQMVIEVGLGFTARSGDPTSVLGAELAVGYGDDEIFILERGAGERLPWVFSFDPHLGWGVNFSKDSRLSLSVDCFNLFNFQAVTRIDETYTQAGVLPIEGASEASDLAQLQNSDGTPFDQANVNPNFGQPTQYQSPRTFRFGARVTF